MAKHTITYRRPESPGSLVRQTTPTSQEAITQLERLAALGYLVVDVDPKLEAKPSGRAEAAIADAAIADAVPAGDAPAH